MLNYTLHFLLLAVVPNIHFGMGHCSAGIDSFAYKYILHLSKTQNANDIRRYNQYAKYCIDPNAITSIIKKQVITDDNESNALAYQATLQDGSQIVAFHFLSGPYKDEVWTQLWQTFAGETLDPLPLPQINYAIIKAFHEQKKLP